MKITFYAVTKEFDRSLLDKARAGGKGLTKGELDSIGFLTITNSRKEALEFIDRYLLLNCKEHFVSWHNIHKANPIKAAYEVFLRDDAKESWDEYKQEVASEWSFLIHKIKYRKKDVAMFLRMLNGCMPMGCSYEGVAEQQEFLDEMGDGCDLGDDACTGYDGNETVVCK